MQQSQGHTTRNVDKARILRAEQGSLLQDVTHTFSPETIIIIDYPTKILPTEASRKSSNSTHLQHQRSLTQPLLIGIIYSGSNCVTTLKYIIYYIWFIVVSKQAARGCRLWTGRR
eukprot:scaffold4372_cov58-Attheya_sp.AAC.3